MTNSTRNKNNPTGMNKMGYLGPVRQNFEKIDDKSLMDEMEVSFCDRKNTKSFEKNPH